MPDESEQVTIRTLHGLAYLPDVRAVVDDWPAFVARFPKYDADPDKEHPQYCVRCRYVYEWLGLKNYRVSWSDGLIYVEPGEPLELRVDELNVW